MSWARATIPPLWGKLQESMEEHQASRKMLPCKELKWPLGSRPIRRTSLEITTQAEVYVQHLGSGPPTLHSHVVHRQLQALATPDHSHRVPFIVVELVPRKQSLGAFTCSTKGGVSTARPMATGSVRQCSRQEAAHLHMDTLNLRHTPMCTSLTSHLECMQGNLLHLESQTPSSPATLCDWLVTEWWP